MAFGDKTKDVAVRMRVIEAHKASADMQRLGRTGQAALRDIERAARPASRGLRAVNAASREVRGSLSVMGSRLGPVGAGLSAMGPAGLVAAAGIGALAAGIGLFMRKGHDAIQVASDVEETIGKFEAVFKTQSRAVRAWATTTAEALGRSKFDLMGYATSGAAGSTGLAGMAYDLVSGRTTTRQLVDRLAAKFSGSSSGGGQVGVASGFGRQGDGGLADDNRRWSADGLGFGPAALAANYQRGVGGALGQLQADWANDYRKVQLVGARVMRGLKDGGRFQAGEDIVVGEDGHEIMRIDKPGTITPAHAARDGDQMGGGDSELLDEFRGLRSDFVDMRKELNHVHRQMAAFAGSHATMAAVRRTRAA